MIDRQGYLRQLFVFSNTHVLSTLPELILPALMISLIGFAETYAVGKVYAQPTFLDAKTAPNQTYNLVDRVDFILNNNKNKGYCSMSYTRTR